MCGLLEVANVVRFSSFATSIKTTFSEVYSQFFRCFLRLKRA